MLNPKVKLEVSELLVAAVSMLTSVGTTPPVVLTASQYKPCTRIETGLTSWR
jgi:hypothetical protein